MRGPELTTGEHDDWRQLAMKVLGPARADRL
jgi:hypothetical protein